MNRKIASFALIVGMFSTAHAALGQDTKQPVQQASGEATERIPSKDVTQPPIPESLIKIGTIGAKYDKLAPRDWDSTPFPTTGDTIVGEAGGVRQKLADHNIGLYLYETTSFDYNLKDAPMYGMPADSDGVRRQVYAGQRVTDTTIPELYITVNMPKTNTQIVMAAADFADNWTAGIGASDFRVADLSINQLLLKNRLKIVFGYVHNGLEYVGLFVGGNMAGGTLGASAIIPSAVGQSYTSHIAPSLNIKYYITPHYYTITGAQRSLNPNGISNNEHDAAGLRFSYQHSRLLLQQELGYLRPAAPGVKKIFVRADGFYNFSHYFDYRSGSLALLTDSSNRANRSDNNWSVSIAADRQFIQPDASLPFRGLYCGATFQYAPPQQNLFTNYYEARIYDIGLSRRRPLDMMTLSVNNTEFSKIALRTFMGTAAYGVSVPSSSMGQSTGDTGQTNYTGGWSWHIVPGMWFVTGIGYTVHPSVTPKLPNPIMFQGGLSMFF